MAKISLEQIRIATPCDAAWDDMSGDDRARFCGSCQKNVYNISGMTRNEAEDMVAEREGDICVRFYRRADGTVLTADCEVGLAAVARRCKRLCGALLAFLGFFTIAGVLELTASAGLSAASPVGRMMNWTQPNRAQFMMGSRCIVPPPVAPPVVVSPVGELNEADSESTDPESTDSESTDSESTDPTVVDPTVVDPLAARLPTDVDVVSDPNSGE